MNPAKPQDLDPRLKEVYERVMNTRVASLPQQQPAQPQPQPQQQAPRVQPTQQTGPVTFRADQVSTKKRGVPFAALVVLGVLFFVAYSLLWLRIFNVKIPFLPL
ncbi:MAG: hypothetical protein A3J69_01285 [Candidatus Levybacteria bacterium RIFCSPHIGHO2_02_FULL_42_12]|nr:MAG: hypothetical protein A2698_02215 [Candidatus Levybacteria bacterium RIFCSPHIGHO2_01_FULL_42_15]OGH33893.1 MAG: hypothetical protein A3J69_01285 [Candidatus Levybacteria bacterium RIFCSPHIGHO2_02_FULL_42_12]OGH42928.1 MAG: hypothetical protein A3B53_02015 [Candidatus Levybacteria bacterium RIFCSPLOWO2_01_FULL_42_15]